MTMTLRTRRALLIEATLMILLIIVAPSLHSCAKEEKAGKTTVRFVTWKPNQPEVWEEVFRIFERENPSIRLETEVGPHSATAFHDLLTQKLKNKSTDVDVFFMDVIWPPEFAAAGWAMPLGEYVTPEEKDEYLAGSILANTYEGELHGVPLFIDSGMLYYRKDLLDKYGHKPPATWQEMLDIAAKIVAEEAKGGTQLYGFSGQFKQYEGLVCDMMEYILSNGGAIVDPETGKSAIHQGPAVEAVRFVRDNIIGKAAPRGVLTYQEPESLDLFVQGKAVFHRNWPYAWQVSNNPKRSSVAGKVGIAKLPHFPGGQSYATLGGWQLGISSYSVNKEAAWKFVKFLSSPRMQKFIALKAGLAPTRKALYEDEEIISAYPQFSQMREVFFTAYPRPRTPLYPAASNILQRYFSKTISDPGSDIEGDAKTASEELDKLLSLIE
jgi:multiple sugar transport system substrate-binding protein